MAIMFATIFSANAQIATENAKLFDNTYVSVGVGAATPLNFSDVLPLNPSATIAVGKLFTPVWGAEIEGTVWGFNENGFKRNNSFDFLKGHYVGVNGLVNLSNLFAGYRGTPRLFEVSTVLGTGWTHRYLDGNDNDEDAFGVRTGLDLAFNLGKAKAHTLSIRPAVFWDVTASQSTTMPAQFNVNHAQLYLGVAYTYHFKTSNGTHHFKTYDVGAMEYEIARLNKALDEKPKEVIVERVVTKEVPATATAAVATVNETTSTVFFAFDSAELDDRAKETLDKLGENGVYCIDAYASSEGSTEYNLALSQRRADAVKEYLEARGCKIESAVGHGVQFGTTTGRVAVVSVK